MGKDMGIENFTPKSPEQLKNQVKKVNVFRITKEDTKPFETPIGYDLTTSVTGSPDYQNYLASLRNLRKFQHMSFLEGQTTPEGSTQQESAYYKANHDPNLARLVLNNLQENKRIDFVTEEISEAAKDETTFISLIENVMTSNIRHRKNNFALLENTLPDETLSRGLQEYFATTAESRSFRDTSKTVGLERLLKYVPKEKLAADFREIAEGKRNRPGQHRDNFAFLLDLSEIDDINNLFTTEELKEIVRNYVENDTNLYLGSSEEHTVDKLLDKGILDEELIERMVFQEIKGIDSLYYAFQLLPRTKITPEQIHDAIKDAFMQTDAPHAHVGRLYLTKDFLSDEERFEIAINLIRRQPNLSYLSVYEPGGDLSELFSETQLFELIQIIVTHPNLRYFNEAREILMYPKTLSNEQKRILFDQLFDHWEEFSQQLKDRKRAEHEERFSGIFDTRDFGAAEFVKKTVELYPKSEQPVMALKILTNISNYIFREAIREGIKYLDRNGVLTLVNNVLSSGNEERIRNVMNNLDQWFDKLEEKELLQFCKEIDAVAPEYFSVSFHIYEVAEHLSPSGFHELSLQLAFQQPFSLLEIADELKIAPDTQTIIQKAQQNEDLISFAPKALRNIFHQLLVTQSEMNKKALIRDGSHLHSQIRNIQRAGFENIVKTIISNEQLSAKQEIELIGMLYGYARIKLQHPEVFKQIDFGVEGLTFEEAKTLLFKAIDQILKREQKTTNEQSSRFLGSMETAVPFIIYLSSRAYSEEHVILLKQIYESLIDSRFRIWKYGEGDKESFESLKSKHLLPFTLSFEQYSAWQQDEQTTLHETLSVETSDIAASVSKYLRDNIEHLSISHIVNSFAPLMKNESYEDLIDKIQDRIREIGKEIHEINLAIKEAKTKGLPEKEKVIQRDDKSSERDQLTRAKIILRLMTLTSSEVAARAFLEGKDKKQKGEEFISVLGRLKQQALPDDRFVYEEVEKMLKQFSENNEAQNIYCTDSSDPKVMLEIGQTPVPSCQNYDGSDLNKSLLGYSEPNTKILIVRNERGNIIARSIFRLLTNSNGVPTLHIERIYSSVASNSITRIIYTHAFKKAQELNIPVVVSKRSQTESGNMEEAKKAKGFKLVAVPYSTKSEGSRAPYVYVDSAAGTTSGEYELTSLLELKQLA